MGREELLLPFGHFILNADAFVDLVAGDLHQMQLVWPGRRRIIGANDSRDAGASGAGVRLDTLSREWKGDGDRRNGKSKEAIHGTPFVC